MDKGDWTHTTTCYISRTWTRRIEPHRTTWALNHWSTAASNNAYEPQKNNVRLIDIEYCGCKKICPCHILKTHSPIIYAAWSTCLFFDYPHTTMIDSPSSFPFPLLACAVLKNIVMSFISCACVVYIHQHLHQLTLSLVAGPMPTTSTGRCWLQLEHDPSWFVWPVPMPGMSSGLMSAA